MTIAPLPPGTQTFLGPNGVVLAGGSVTNYIPNTTSAKATYGNPGQTVTNTNPITLSAGGGAVIYGFGAIRQIVKDSSGNTISDSVTFGGTANQTTIVLDSPDSNNFVVPPGVYALYVEGVGGGGAGSDALAAVATSDVSGGGGAAGGFASGLYAVTPGQAIPYTVGAGGGIGSQAKGGTTAFGSFINCAGGAGSNFFTQGTSLGGNGGTASGGTIRNQSGGDGTDGSHIPSSGGAPYIGSGNGGASAYGQGGTSSNGATGHSGGAPGSGGGGVMDVNLTSIVYNGGAGAAGQIIISYWG